MYFKQTLSRHLANIPGWRTNRKILVIQSDDWGSIRTPSKKVYDSLLTVLPTNSLSLYDSLDSLERRTDLQNLLEIGSQFKDKCNNPLVFTLNTVMQNPEFSAIRSTGYIEFIGMPFLQSYQKYYGEHLLDLWYKGIEEKLLSPQFHAREHLNEYLWLKDLRNGKKDVSLSFDHDFFALKTTTSSKKRNHYLATYYAETEEEFDRVAIATKKGLEIFKNVFGNNSITFIASNYIWSKELEYLLKKNGIMGIQAQVGNTFTNYKNGTTTTKRFFTGQKNDTNQIYIVRNVIFEPYMDTNKDWVNTGLEQVKNAFFWRKPAIVSMHRVNFASNMNVKNRDMNLRTLKEFIGKIVKKYPDIEFMSSDQLINLILNKR